MRLYRFLVMLLLAVFLADTAMASASLHLPDAAAPATMQMNAHQHHAKHADAQHENGYQQHGDDCRNCHDCLSCFSVLPISIPMAMPDAPPHPVIDAFNLIYFPPALAQLQRPPISFSS